MLEQLDLQGGGPGDCYYAESVQGVVKLDHRHEAVIQDPCHSIPEDFNHTNTAEVDGPLCYQENGLPVVLLHEVTFTEIRLDQANDHLPFRGVWRILPSGLPQPVSKILCLHSRRSVSPVYV